jgi:hypothetical protein
MSHEDDILDDLMERMKQKKQLQALLEELLLNDWERERLLTPEDRWLQANALQHAKRCGINIKPLGKKEDFINLMKKVDAAETEEEIMSSINEWLKDH